MDGYEIDEMLPTRKTLMALREAKKELEQVPFTGGIHLDGKDAGQVLAMAAALVDHVLDQAWDREIIRKEFVTMLLVLDAISNLRRKVEKKKRRKKK
jgi:hypothetical protein